VEDSAVAEDFGAWVEVVFVALHRREDGIVDWMEGTRKKTYVR
jgi:hypothetical protein